MVRIPNPYIAGPPIGGDEGFYGRQDVFDFVRRTFASTHQKVIVLFGQRRVGKTSILYQLQKPSNLPEGFHPVYFNLEGRASQNLNEVLHALAEKIAESLNLPSVAQSKFQGDGDYFSKHFLPQAYEALQDQRLLLLFDEFDVLSEELSDATMALNTFFPYLQKRLFDEEKLVYIFVVGRRLEELTPEFLATFKQARTRPISFLSREDARRLIREPLLGVVEYDDDAIEQILSVTACHPYLTQLVCFELVDYLDSLGKTRVTVDDVNAVIDDAIESGGSGLAWLWDGLPIAERFILSAVTSVTDENGIATKESINEALRRHRVQLLGIELTRAPDMLVDWGWLEKTEERGGYKFVVELLRRWISRKHSPENAKRELESISKRAIRDYTYARQAHIDGDLEIAVESYRRALAANPNHAGAQLGLAQALHEQGQIEEAVTEYEKAYTLDEIASEGLIKALLASGEALEKDATSVAEAVKRYERVLEIAPDNEVARKRLTDIKLAEAEAYEQQREWKRANDVYTWLIREFDDGEAKRRLQRMLEQWSLANLYAEAMVAHTTKMWDLAQEKWERLYSRNPDYVGEDGQKVSDLLKEAIVQRERIARRKRNLRLALVAAASAFVLIPLGTWGITKYRRAQLIAALTPTATATLTPSPSPSPSLTPTPTQVSIVIALSPTPTLTPTSTPTGTTTPKPTATATNTPTFTPSPTWTPTSTPVTPPPKPLGTVEVWDVDINPRNSNMIYAVVKGQGIYRSTDGGYRWEAAERTFETVESLAIDPTNPSVLYAPIWDGILKSTDSGATWELIAVGKDALPEPAHVLAVVPGNGQIIYAGTEGGVYRSSNGGQKWEARNKGMADTPIYSLVIGSRDGKLIYAAGKSAEIWKSIDGGSSPWEKLSSGYLREAIYALALHPRNSQWIYAGTNDSTVVLSTNGGRNWQLRNWGLEYQPLSLKISSLAIDPSDSRIIYAGTGFRSNLNGHGIYKSTDGA
ncbi:MAG TPA: tetratricopeptide repeat protein [Anaerolineae bacterium]|nr:tetratricopeptide repeat protein [Anaerolineae bacterium]